MNNHPYKVNFNSMRGLSHVREVCLRFTKNLFLKLLDFTASELTALLQLAAKLKADKKNGTEEQKLVGKKYCAHLRKRLDPDTMLFRSCRIRSGRARDVPGLQREPDRP